MSHDFDPEATSQFPKKLHVQNERWRIAQGPQAIFMRPIAAHVKLMLRRPVNALIRYPVQRHLNNGNPWIYAFKRIA